MTAQPTPPHWNAPPLMSPADCAEQARAYYEQGWLVYCCTAYVGMSTTPEEYVEPHWLIQAIEAHGWQLQQLDYLCIELDRAPHILGTATQAICRIEAKLMFRRPAAPEATDHALTGHQPPEGDDQ